MTEVKLVIIKSGNYDLINYNNEDYVFTDKYIYNQKVYYLFENYDNYLFFQYENNTFYNVNNLETLDKLTELADLKPPKYFFSTNKFKIKNLPTIAKNLKEIDPETINIAINYFCEDIKKTDCSLSKEEIESLFKEKNWYTGIIEVPFVEGLYHPFTNSIILNNDYQNYLNYNILFHEMIHALTNNLLIAFFHTGKGLIEGSTELITVKALGEKKSYNNGEIITNFDSNSYNMQVSIVWQMEYLLNNTVTNSIIQGKTDFFKEFINKYGMPLFVNIKHSLNRITGSHFPFKHPTLALFNLQNQIMEECFDKDFASVNNIEDATFFLKRLNDFGERRIREVPGDKDIDLENYYNKKLIEIKNRLLYQNMSEQEVNDFIKNHPYKTIQFATVYTIEEAYQENYKFIKIDMNGENIPIDNCIFYNYEIDGKYYTSAVHNNNIIITYGNDLYDSRKQNHINISIVDGHGYFEGKEIHLTKLNLGEETKSNSI